jgi:hypothetical protein
MHSDAPTLSLISGKRARNAAMVAFPKAYECCTPSLPHLLEGLPRCRKRL